MAHFTWSRHGGYECSSKGDIRFSAFGARLEDGRTIEEHYQCDVKGYDVGGTDWARGKGRPPKDRSINLKEEYKDLWFRYACMNPDLMEELKDLAKDHGNVLSDRFATSDVNQAWALSEVLNESSYLDY